MPALHRQAGNNLAISDRLYFICNQVLANLSPTLLIHVPFNRYPFPSHACIHGWKGGATPTSETYGRLSSPRRNGVSFSSKRYMARGDRPPQSSKVFPCVHGWHPCQNRSPWQPFVGFLPRLHVHRMVRHKHYASSTLTILSLYLLVKPSLVQILGDPHCIAARVDSYS